MSRRGGLQIRLVGDWKRLRRALNGQAFSRALQGRVSSSLQDRAEALRDAARHPRGMAPNAGLTIMIKSGSTPLRDTGDLMDAIQVDRTTKFRYSVGVDDSNPKAHIVKLLHNGGLIPVTDEMRAMFKALWWASEGSLDPGDLTGRARELWQRHPGGWLPLSESTSAIRIPARPFLAKALEDPGYMLDTRKELLYSSFQAWLDVAGRR